MDMMKISASFPHGMDAPERREGPRVSIRVGLVIRQKL